MNIISYLKLLINIKLQFLLRWHFSGNLPTLHRNTIYNSMYMRRYVTSLPHLKLILTKRYLEEGSISLCISACKMPKKIKKKLSSNTLKIQGQCPFVQNYQHEIISGRSITSKIVFQSNKNQNNNSNFHVLPLFPFTANKWNETHINENNFNASPFSPF